MGEGVTCVASVPHVRVRAATTLSHHPSERLGAGRLRPAGPGARPEGPFATSPGCPWGSPPNPPGAMDNSALNAPGEEPTPAREQGMISAL